MRWKWMTVLVVLCLVTGANAAEAPAYKTDNDKQSYAIGVDLARNLKRQGITADTSALLEGLRDELSGTKLLMSEEELRMTLNAFQVNLKKSRARALRAVAELNKEAGEAFLAANQAKQGVVTLPSGLQYKIIQEGSGKRPTANDTVEVNYRGTLINGAEFENSYRREQPPTLKVTGVIPGLTEALKLMPAGSKWELFIPPELAYGERGSGRRIGPNATLIFELELLAIK
jgi:FKBP-type peptidyl-prolyl cis-trans isomerase